MDDEERISEETCDLDEHVPLLATLDECRKSIEFWKARYAKIQAQIAEVMGSATVGLVDGREVLTYRWENRFRATDFKKAYPDTYRTFTHVVEHKEFDASWLRQVRPELYDQFRVRSMRSNWEG